jgi:hypothetical protein
VRYRSLAPRSPAAWLALAAVACGGVPFESATTPPGDDGGGETSTVTVGPPRDAGIDSTLPGHADASTDAATQADGAPVTDAPYDATSTDATADSGPPDAAPACGSATPKLCGTSCVPLTNPDYGCADPSCTECDLPNATSTCGATGACAIGTCADGYADCNSNPVDGCETDITSATNCGKCGTKCLGGSPYCIAGASGYSCGDNCPDAGPNLCGATCVDEQTDPSHCGSCSKACTGAGANATNTCVDAGCGTACISGYDQCDGGCVNYTDSNGNCGSCGHACPSVANGSDTCVSSSCNVVCNPTFTLCTAGGTSTCVAPDTVHGVFVSKSSVTTACGSTAVPCGTIAAGIAVAKAQGLTILYLDAATYTEQVTLPNGLTIEGGWFDKGGDWVKSCDGTTDPSALAIIQPTSIASGPAASVLANGVTATLRTLTVKSLATAATGQSLYGVFATNGANVTMTAVEVSVAAGGAGTSGGSGAAPVAQTPPCPASDGHAASAVANGTPTNATYTSAGYVPGNGNGGAAGADGDNGTPGDPGSCASSPCGGTSGAPVCTGTAATASCTAGAASCGCSAQGTSGCGGPGGALGTGGTGGGASIGVFAWGATVSVTGGSVATSDGGPGGAGASGGTAPTSWANSAGAVGATGTFDTCDIKTVCVGASCSSYCDFKPGGSVPGGGAGGVGGQGSAGGAGASGSGGDSLAYVAPVAGSGVVHVTGATLTCGSGGTSPGPVKGTAGSNGSAACHL